MKKESGFTLIEIVMVLVLLGILSAVAVPKYFDLQEQAKLRSAQAALAEAQAQVNALFAQALLSGGSCTAAVAAAQARKETNNLTTDYVNGKAMGEWTVSWTAVAHGETPKDLKVQHKVGKANPVEIDLTKLQNFNPTIVIPACYSVAK